MTIRLPRWPLLPLLLVALLAAPLAGAADAQAIDVAGRQRMLTQRIVKAWCQVGLQVTPEPSATQLRDSVRRFDEQFAQLSAVATDEASKQALQRVGDLWLPLRRLATGPVRQDLAPELDRQAEALLQASESLVGALEAAAGAAPSRLVDLAGRQRMLSQRLAKLYMLRAWGHGAPLAQHLTEQAASEFGIALARLRAAPQNTLAIRTELDAVALQWEWFKAALALQGAQSYLLVVAHAAESMLGSMEVVTAAYAALEPR